MTSAHPSFGSQCSTCHTSADEDTAAFIAEESTTESTTEENATEATTEEDTTTPTTAVDTVVPTPTIPPTTKEDVAKPTIETNTTTPSTTKEDVVKPTTEKNTAKLTTVPGNKNVAQFITQFDLNGDGQITQDEVQALQSEFFDKADTNADGFLTNEEWQVAKKTQKIQLVGYNELSCGADFNRLDNNKDGLISKEEFVNNVPLFDQFDLDNNGIITAKELTMKKPRHPWMSHQKLYNNWINEMSYNEIGHKKKGKFIRYYQ
jgi:Ca2+-binding EF-hand superfamily protein